MLRAAPLLAIALACAPAAAAFAQDRAPHAAGVAAEAPAVGTGDAWIDVRLADMDRYAARYREAFIDEIVRYLEAPRPVVERALSEGGMRPGDVYYGCALARASGRPCRALLDAWRQDASGGWEGVAATLGLEPDARRHRRIREDIGASYRRWSRPIDGSGATGS